MDLRTVDSKSAFITKINADSSYAWTAVFEALGGQGESASVVHRVASDGEGNIIAGGKFEGVVDFDPLESENVLSAVGAENAFVAKIAPNGDALWTRTFGGTGTVGGGIVTADFEGNVFVGGFFYETADFDPTSNVDNRTSNGDIDVFVTKLRVDGSYDWTATFGGPGLDAISGLATDSQGAVVMLGIFEETVDFDPSEGVDTHTASGPREFFSVKLLADGAFAWSVATSGSGRMFPGSVSVDARDAIVLSGTFESTVEFDPGPSSDIRVSHGDEDGFVWKLNGDGSRQWVVTIGGMGLDRAFQMTTDNEGNVYVAGLFSNAVDFDPSPATDIRVSQFSDPFVTKFDTDGRYGWTVTIDRSSGGSVYLYGLDVDQVGNALLVGKFSGTWDFNPGDGVDYLDADDGSVFVTQFASLPGRCCETPYGDADGSGDVGLFDILCVLDGFVGEFDNCSPAAVDIAPCDPDGQVDIFDIFAVLDAFQGKNLCTACLTP